MDVVPEGMGSPFDPMARVQALEQVVYRLSEAVALLETRITDLENPVS